MFTLRARSFEEDVVTSGFAEAFGDVNDALRAVRFADPVGGAYGGDGGFIGAGGMLVHRYASTEARIGMENDAYITLEAVTSGATHLRAGDRVLTSRPDASTLAGPCRFEMAFAPGKATVTGLQICMTLPALDRFLARGGETRDGAIAFRVTRGPFAAREDRMALEFAQHLLRDFDRYREGAPGRHGPLAEALLSEMFVEFLIAVGALRLKPRREDPRQRVARLAMDHLVAHCADPLSIADVAAAAGASIRTLQVALREAFGSTFRELLLAARLDQARERLQAHPGTSVTSVALDCGMVHLGRFAQAYRRRHGEFPSDTARKPPKAGSTARRS